MIKHIQLELRIAQIQGSCVCRTSLSKTAACYLSVSRSWLVYFSSADIVYEIAPCPNNNSQVKISIWYYLGHGRFRRQCLL